MSKLAIYIILSIAIFISGFLTLKKYYSNQTKTITEIQNHTITKIVKVTSPNGTVTESTTIDSATKTDKVQTIAKANKSNLSVLASIDYTKSQLTPVYGVSFSKEVLGPITVGAFILTNKTVGLSIGYSF